MTFTRKILTAALSALAFGGAVLATAAPAEARGWRYRGGAVVVGVGAGLALGAIAASAAAAQPVYYASGCGRVRQPVTDVFGNVLYYRTVKVCR
ncbi:MAG TPA: hypothetical protein VHL98_17305 [Microvirga sp.]|jgi:hypothetical protein|nr:hypothetical protein [Microvirga sp.]